MAILNVYEKFDNPEELDYYNEISNKMELLSNPYKWSPDIIEDLKPLMGIIKKSPKYILAYVNLVIKRRWLEMEPIIMKDPETAYAYTKNILSKDKDWTSIKGHEGGRWPEAEPVIMKDSKAAYNYAKEIIQGRWKEAEQYIMKDPQNSFAYAKNVLDGRWKDIGKPEAEEIIKKDPAWAYYYAEQIMKERWPEAEPYIKTEGFWYDYKRKFGISEFIGATES